jgi:hypothetical protein
MGGEFRIFLVLSDVNCGMGKIGLEQKKTLYPVMQAGPFSACEEACREKRLDKVR